MEQPLVAAGQRRADALAVGRLVPVRGGGHRARVRREARSANAASAVGAARTSWPRFSSPASAHLGGARVAEVRVVRPDHDRASPPAPSQMADAAPRASPPCACRAGSTRRRGRRTSRGSTPRRSCTSRAFCSAKKYSSAPSRPSRLAYSAPRRCRSTQLGDARRPRRTREPDAGGVAVGLRVLAEVLEAAVAVAGALRRLRVDLAAGSAAPRRSRRAGCRGRGRRSRSARPPGSVALCARSHSTKSTTGRLRHIQRGKRVKSPSAATASPSPSSMPHAAVDAIGVGPVGLHGDRREALLRDQRLRQLGAHRGRTRGCRATPRRSGRAWHRRSPRAWARPRPRSRRTGWPRG